MCHFNKYTSIKWPIHGDYYPTLAGERNVGYKQDSSRASMSKKRLKKSRKRFEQKRLKKSRKSFEQNWKRNGKQVL